MIMKKFNLNDIFLVKEFVKNETFDNEEQRSYFEIVFIEKGKGKLHFNEYIIGYTEGDVFLVTPEDKYHFAIDVETKFSYFQFTELLFFSKMNLPNRSYWLHRIEHIIHHPNLHPGDILKDHSDRKLIWQIHDLVITEYSAKKDFFKHTVSNLVSTALSIIARNISDGFAKNDIKKKTANVDEILAYIKQHIYDNQLMKISSLAGKFQMTNAQLSAFFKKSTGESLHHYILMYKLELIKYRLENTDFTVSEIAQQLGFTDESHLTRIFKKYNQITPKQYKKQVLNVA